MSKRIITHEFNLPYDACAFYITVDKELKDAYKLTALFSGKEFILKHFYYKHDAQDALEKLCDAENTATLLRF